MSANLLLLSPQCGLLNMNDKLPDEVVTEIVDLINRKLDIPFLNEKQEEALFKLLLSVIIETLWKLKKT